MFSLQASMMDGVGVFSFARYDPSGRFLSEGLTLPPLTDAEKNEVLRRSCRVLAHEGTHVVGLKHCIHFACLMNGSNNLEESDRAPLHLCPVCLRKLAEGCGFHPLQRYWDLLEWYDQHGFDEQKEWTRARIARIEEVIASEEVVVSSAGNATQASIRPAAKPRLHKGERVVVGVQTQKKSSVTCALFKCRGKR